MSSSSSSLSKRRVGTSSLRQRLKDDAVGGIRQAAPLCVARGGDAASTSPGATNKSRYKKYNDDGSDKDPPFSLFGTNVTTTAVVHNWTAWCFKSLVGMTVALYILNQKHLLPKPLSAVVSKTLFWPTLPITACRRIGTWTTVVDDTVVMGGAPLSFIGMPQRLYDEYGVRGVVNMCKEYRGPARQYEELGVKELWLPTVDHFEPSFQDLKLAVSFIQGCRERGERVYVHCRAGHGRSAAAVFAYLLSQEPSADPLQLNQEFCKLRNVRKTLWRQPNIKRFHSWLKNGGKVGELDRTLHDSSDSELE